VQTYGRRRTRLRRHQRPAAGVHHSVCAETQRSISALRVWRDPGSDDPVSAPRRPSARARRRMAIRLDLLLSASSDLHRMLYGSTGPATASCPIAMHCAMQSHPAQAVSAGLQRYSRGWPVRTTAALPRRKRRVLGMRPAGIEPAACGLEPQQEGHTTISHHGPLAYGARPATSVSSHQFRSSQTPRAAPEVDGTTNTLAPSSRSPDPSRRSPCRHR
jgi:hypothetical protein